MVTPAIEIERLTKRYGSVLAVDDLSFHVLPGRVTGFLGPNGAGKTTTMRVLLGLASATSGRAVIGGVAYRELASPLRQVGASLEATSFHPGRTAHAHLSILARAAGLPTRRADEVLELVGLAHAGHRKVGGYSLGMRQRLGLAVALLGDPEVLVLDEPINGLDPEGIRWVRGFLRALAAEGRTVLISSHVLSEVEQVVDDLVVIARGRSVYQGPLSGLTTGPETVLVGGQEFEALMIMLAPHIMEITPERRLRLEGISVEQVGEQARLAGVALTHLSVETRNLEEVFLELVESGHGPVASSDDERETPPSPVDGVGTLPPPDPTSALPVPDPSKVIEAPVPAAEGSTPVEDATADECMPDDATELDAAPESETGNLAAAPETDDAAVTAAHATPATPPPLVEPPTPKPAGALADAPTSAMESLALVDEVVGTGPTLTVPSERAASATDVVTDTDAVCDADAVDDVDAATDAAADTDAVTDTDTATDTDAATEKREERA